MENFKLQGTAFYSNQRMCNCLKPSLGVANSLLLFFFLHVTKCVALRTQLTLKCLVVCLFGLFTYSFFLEVASAFDRLRHASVMLCVEVLCSVSLLVFYQYQFRVMIGYFDRNNVALEKNQLDWRTDRRFGQWGKYDSVILQKIKSSSISFHLSLQDATLENENIKNGDTLIVEEGRLPPKVINLETFNKRRLQSYDMCTKGPLLQFDRFFAILFFVLAGISSSFIVANKSERTKFWRRSRLDYIGYTRLVDLIIFFSFCLSLRRKVLLVSAVSSAWSDQGSSRSLGSGHLQCQSPPKCTNVYRQKIDIIS